MDAINAPALKVGIETVKSEDVHGLVECCIDEEGLGEREAIWEELSGPNVQMIVARLDGEVVGSIALLDNVTYGVCRHLFVAPDLRGTGLGALLVTELERAAGEIGLRKVMVVPEDSRRHAKRLTSYGYVASQKYDGWMSKEIIRAF